MVKPRRLGHVFLWVRDVERSREFYSSVLELTVKHSTPGKSAFLTATEDSSHELALGEVGMDAKGPEPKNVGLYHLAWEMGSFDDLKSVYHKMRELDAKVVGFGGRDTSLGIYFHDPDGNENEAFYEPSLEERQGDRAFIDEFPGSLEESEPAQVA